MSSKLINEEEDTTNNLNKSALRAERAQRIGRTEDRKIMFIDNVLDDIRNVMDYYEFLDPQLVNLGVSDILYGSVYSHIHDSVLATDPLLNDMAKDILLVIDNARGKMKMYKIPTEDLSDFKRIYELNHNTILGKIIHVIKKYRV